MSLPPVLSKQAASQQSKTKPSPRMVVDGMSQAKTVTPTMCKGWCEVHKG